MEATFNIMESNRKNILKLVENYSVEQLNKIPDGFSNNLVWNLGHIIVSQQGLVYRLSGLPYNIPDEMVLTYKNGSKPTGTTSEAEIIELKRLLFALIEQTRQDYIDGKFTSYREFVTGTGFLLTSTQDALEYNNCHEALHLGLMMNIQKFL